MVRAPALTARVGPSTSCSRASLGIEPASLEKARSLLVYAPAVLVVPSFFATCPVRCQREREGEDGEREARVAPPTDLTPEGGE